VKTQSVDPSYKYFRSQEDDETIIFVIRKHWTHLIFPIMFGGLIMAIMIGLQFLISYFASDGLDSLAQVIITCIFSLIYLYILLYIFISWLLRYLNVVILTNEHLVEIQQLGLFSRKVSELDLDSIEDATSSQHGFFATMLQFGDVLIQTAGELPNFNIQRIGDPEEVQQKVMEVKEIFMKTNHFNGNGDIARQDSLTENISNNNQANN